MQCKQSASHSLQTDNHANTSSYFCARCSFSRPTLLFHFSTVVATRGHQFKLFKEHRDVTVRKSFFSQHVINVWNSLLLQIVDFRSLRSFKRTVKLVDFSSFLTHF